MQEARSPSRRVVRVDGVAVVPDAGGDWRQVIAAYLVEKDVMEESRKTYKKALVQFFRWVDLTGRRLSDLTCVDILEWKDWLNASGHSVLTRSLYIVAVKGFYQWAEGKRLYPNIAKDVKASKASERKRTAVHGEDGKAEQGYVMRFVKQHLSDEQGASFLEHFRNAPVPHLKDGSVDFSARAAQLRDYAMMNLMIRTGVRSIEVSGADIRDYSSLHGRPVLYVRGKGRSDKSDFVVLSKVVTGPLDEYLATRPRALVAEPLFVCEGRGSKGRRLSARMIQHIGKEGLRAIGLDGHAYSVHSLRHTAGVQILLNGGTQFDVQDVLRHASPVTSQIYLESIKEERRVKSAPEDFLDRAFRSSSPVETLDDSFLK